MAMKFPPLLNGGNRPVTWDIALDGVVGEKRLTNSVTIYLNPNTDYNESGEYPGRVFASVTITRAELREMLEFLEEDIAAVRASCPDDEFG